MNKDYYAVIMAGGIGSRFWPVSTSKFPKQFHDMLGTGQTLLQKTFSRLSGLIPTENILVLTNERYLELTMEQLPQIKESQVVLEPAMLNTAPCILLSALKIQKENPNALMVVAPSDHWIEDEEAFLKDLQLSFDACQREEILMTLGIEPTFPNTGYGYIEAEENRGTPINKVKQFREKPNYKTAKGFLEAGNFLWNAGIFIWSVTSISKAFKDTMTEMYSLFSEGIEFYNTSEEKTFIAENYIKAENISIDYGIMEKANNVFVKKAGFDWNDLGTWGALHNELGNNEEKNVSVRAILHTKDAKGNMVYTDSNKLVVIDSLNDHVIVDKDDVLMIFPKSKDQNIKILLEEIKQKFGDTYI